MVGKFFSCFLIIIVNWDVLGRGYAEQAMLAHCRIVSFRVLRIVVFAFSDLRKIDNYLRIPESTFLAKPAFQVRRIGTSDASPAVSAPSPLSTKNITKRFFFLTTIIS